MIISILILAMFSINGIICQMNQFPNGFMMYSSYPANQYNPNFNRDYNQDQNRFGNQENFNQFNWKQQYQNLSESRQIGTHTMSNQNWNQQDNQKDCTAPRTRGDFCQNEQKLMFYYDLARKVCQPFMYNGCNGNGNRFSSAVECKEYCAGEKGLVQPLKDVPQENTQIMKNTCQGEYDTMHLTVQRCSYSQECSMGHECQGGICCPTRKMIYLYVFLLPVVLSILYIITRFLWELLTVGDLSSKAVFITGCDTGFGRELAKKCAKNGFTVFAGCLTSEGEKSLKEECPLSILHTLPLDVTSEESIQEAKKYVESVLSGSVKLWAVVNNAGIFSCYGPDDWLNIEDYKLSLEVNTLGVIRVTQKFLKASKGRIVTVTSVNGRLSSPAAGPYVVAKFGTEAYMDSIRQELYHFDVKCSILEPGIFRTPLINEQAMLDRVNKVWSRLDEETKAEYGENFKDYCGLKHIAFVCRGNRFHQIFFSVGKTWNKTYISMSSTNFHHVVDNYYHALTAKYPRHRYYCGWDAKFLFVPLSLLPTWWVDFIIRKIAKQEVVPACLEAKLKKQ
uniref:BPTI/Kunitz inhibitor domain-containing protein n=1 Tax=Heterorhabditis bacteriophora TaxID=37862 RepID=A0A1I7XLF6_HETBA